MTKEYCSKVKEVIAAATAQQEGAEKILADKMNSLKEEVLAVSEREKVVSLKEKEVEAKLLKIKDLISELK